MSAFLEFTLFGSVIWFWIISIIFIISLFISEIYEEGFSATLSFIIFCVLVQFWGNISIFSYFNIKLISLYIILGFIYSLIRVYFKGIEFNNLIDKAKFKDSKINGPLSTPNFYENCAIKDKANFKLKEHIFRWWGLWVISLTVWIFSDLFKNLWNFIYSRLEKFYLKVFNV